MKKTGEVNMNKNSNIEKQIFVSLGFENEIAIITIDNPPVNSLTKEVMSELSSTLDTLGKKREVRAAIITGSGEKCFVAGADINQFPHLDGKSGEEMVRYGQEIFNKINHLSFPVICAVNGLALGGGCELVLACDIRVAAENAKFGFPEVGLGIIPGYGGTQRLPRLVGIGKAKELIFSGEPISSQEAYRLGLIEKLVPTGEALQQALELARKVVKRGPLAVSKAKQVINQGIEMTLQDGLDLEARFSGELFGSQDKNEGAKAFFEKRVPIFKGV